MRADIKTSPTVLHDYTRRTCRRGTAAAGMSAVGRQPSPSPAAAAGSRCRYFRCRFRRRRRCRCLTASRAWPLSAVRRATRRGCPAPCWRRPQTPTARCPPAPLPACIGVLPSENFLSSTFRSSDVPGWLRPQISAACCPPAPLPAITIHPSKIWRLAKSVATAKLI